MVSVCVQVFLIYMCACVSCSLFPMLVNNLDCGISWPYNHLFVILLFQKCNKTKVSGSTYDTDVEFTDWVRVQE